MRPLHSSPFRLARAVVAGALLLAAPPLLSGCGDSDDGGAAAVAQCGNGRLDSGERCDDGNQIDEDDCTAVCRPARCGDGAVHTGVEQCDGTNITLTCVDAGYAGGADGRSLPGCTTDTCQYDFGRCGAAFTPTPIVPTATATATPTATPSPSPTPTFDETTCGNGLLDMGETCATCPADCTPAACAPAGTTTTFRITLATDGRVPTTASLLLAYRSSTISIPGTGSAADVRRRVRFLAPLPDPQSVVDRDYAVALAGTARTGAVLAVAPDTLATAQFDVCAGAPAATVADLTCFLETCADSTGAIPDCRCTVTAAP